MKPYLIVILILLISCNNETEDKPIPPEVKRNLEIEYYSNLRSLIYLNHDRQPDWVQQEISFAPGANSIIVDTISFDAFSLHINFFQAEKKDTLDTLIFLVKLDDKVLWDVNKTFKYKLRDITTYYEHDPKNLWAIKD